MDLPKEVPVITQSDVFRPGENVYVQMSTENSDFCGVIHKHTFIELVYIVSGSAIHVVGDRCVPASRGDLFIINYDTPHAFFKNETSGESFVAYDLLFTPDFFDRSLIHNLRFESIHSSFLFYSLFPGQQLGPDVHISGSSYNTFGELFHKIYLEFVGREDGYISIIRAYVIELIIKMFRKMNSAPKSDNAHRQSQVVETTLNYLKENYQKQISLEDLAAQVFLSKDYFARLFRETTGMPIIALLQKIRVEEACKMLASSNEKVAQIAALCGFHDLKNFYTAFKKHTGMTPRQYRLENAIEINKNE